MEKANKGNPHMCLERTVPLGLECKVWRCVDCGKEGGLDDLQSTWDCTAETQPCDWCGQHPFCAEDCPGMLFIDMLGGKSGVQVPKSKK